MDNNTIFGTPCWCTVFVVPGRWEKPNFGAFFDTSYQNRSAATFKSVCFDNNLEVGQFSTPVSPVTLTTWSTLETKTFQRGASYTFVVHYEPRNCGGINETDCSDWAITHVHFDHAEGMQVFTSAPTSAGNSKAWFLSDGQDAPIVMSFAGGATYTVALDGNPLYHIDDGRGMLAMMHGCTDAARRRCTDAHMRAWHTLNTRSNACSHARMRTRAQ